MILIDCTPVGKTPFRMKNVTGDDWSTSKGIWRLLERAKTHPKGEFSYGPARAREHGGGGAED